MEIVSLPDKYNQSALRLAQSILEKCESGEITEIIAIVTRADGSYMTMGTATKNTAEQVGKLLVCAFDACKFAEEK